MPNDRHLDIRLSEYQRMRTSGNIIVTWYPDVHYLMPWYPDDLIKVFMHFDFYQQTKVFGLLV